MLSTPPTLALLLISFPPPRPPVLEMKMPPVNDVKGAEQKLWVNVSTLWGLFFYLKVSCLSSTLAFFLLRLQHPPPG